MPALIVMHILYLLHLVYKESDFYNRSLHIVTSRVRHKEEKQKQIPNQEMQI